MPFGGTVTPFSMPPLALCGYYLGTRRGVLTGFAVGLMNLIFGPYVIHPCSFSSTIPLPSALWDFPVFSETAKTDLETDICSDSLPGISAPLLPALFSSETMRRQDLTQLHGRYGIISPILQREGIITVIIISLPPVKNALEGLKKTL